MTEPCESVILCEGYYDRAFWAGWLKFLGCRLPDPNPQKEARDPIKDPWGKSVTRGQHGYTTPSGGFLRVVPCMGKTQILDAARERLIRRNAQRLLRLLINTDADTLAGDGNAPAGFGTDDLLAILKREFDPEAHLTEDGDIALDAGETLVSLLQWQAEDDLLPGVPPKQTLERLACAAIIEAYPERGKIVQEWIEARTNLSQADGKMFAWTHMAGWYAESGCDYFYTGLWGDERIRTALEQRLRSIGAWRLGAALTQ